MARNIWRSGKYVLLGMCLVGVLLVAIISYFFKSSGRSHCHYDCDLALMIDPIALPYCRVNQNMFEVRARIYANIPVESLRASTEYGNYFRITLDSHPIGANLNKINAYIAELTIPNKDQTDCPKGIVVEAPGRRTILLSQIVFIAD